MKNCIISIDLGSTNYKFSLYSSKFEEVCSLSLPVTYIEEGNQVEFSPQQYMFQVYTGLRQLREKADISSNDISIISLTGQAESFIITDDDANPLNNGISWMDNRSSEECNILEEVFCRNEWYNTTGLPAVTTTWSVTKLLWFKKHKPEIFQSIKKFFLVKDYVTYQLTNQFASEFSVFSFSGLLDLKNKRVWQKMIDYLGLPNEVFPTLVEPGTIIGTINSKTIQNTGLSALTKVSVGALDHAAGMIGTGNLDESIINVSAGTVQALAVNTGKFINDNKYIECHYGPLNNSFIKLLVIESGGVCLQWYRDHFLPNASFKDIDNTIPQKTTVLFLPYVCGLNPPDFDNTAKGVFYGFDVHNDQYDFALSIMESNCFLLKKTIAFLEDSSQPVSKIYEIGGASKSERLCQMFSDITGKEVITFQNSESTSLGAAIIAANKAGLIDSISQCVKRAVKIVKTFTPTPADYYEKKYQKFINLYNTLFPIGSTRL